MTPQEKAKELVDKFSEYASEEGIQSGDKNLCAKECALIAVQEIIKELEQLSKPEYTIFVTSYEPLQTMQGYEKKDYWDEVKEEIEKL